jgi:4-hydroxy-2-oxoheptanedioate aldolase
VQIETVAAVESLEEIAAVPGIDVLFVGPQDLATSMGLWPASMTDMPPAYARAIESVPPVARRHNKHAGILVYDEDVARHCIALGYTFVGLHADATMLLEKARAAVRALHETSG